MTVSEPGQCWLTSNYLGIAGSKYKMGVEKAILAGPAGNLRVEGSSSRPKVSDVLHDAYAVHGVKLWWLLLLMSIVALGEGMSMTLLLPLLSVIGIDGLVGNGLIQSFVREVLSITGVSGSVLGALALVLSAFAIQTSLSGLQTWWVADLQRRYGAHWQQRLFEAFVRARWSFLARHRQGLLTNAITQETLRLSGAFMVMAQTASTLVVVLVYVAIASFLSWPITLSLIALAVALFLAIRGLSRRSYKFGAEISKNNTNLMVLIGEYLAGAKLVKATATEPRAIGDIYEVTEKLRKYHTWATFLPGLTRSVFEFASIAALCAILVIGHLYLDALAAHMLLILGLFVRLLPRFNALQQNVQLLNSFLPALVELKTLYATALREQEPGDAAALSNVVPGGALAVDHLQAGYESVPILRDISLEIPERGFVGIVGESGAGKSTFVHTLLGLCELQGGDIRLGGVSIHDVSIAAWRRAIGYVPQETILFHRSVRDNIAWGREAATDEEIVAAARRAKAHEFIMALPDGYDTLIGDQGMRLSGGQRQRLGIARALLVQPRFLLLDEATSALDSASEEAVLETLEILRRELCIISVAHRLATVRGADRIVVLGDGKLLENGDWTTLIAQHGSLYQLAQKQHMVQ